MADRVGEAVAEIGGTGKEKLDFILRYSNEVGVSEQLPDHLRGADQFWMVGLVAEGGDPTKLNVNYAAYSDGQTNSMGLRRRVRREYSQGQAMFSSVLESRIFEGDKSKESTWKEFEIDIMRNAATRLAEFEGRLIGGYAVSHMRSSDTIMGGAVISDALLDTFLTALRTGGFQTTEELKENSTPEQLAEMSGLSIKTPAQKLNTGMFIGGLIARTLPLRAGLRPVFGGRKAQTGWRSGTIWS